MSRPRLLAVGGALAMLLSACAQDRDDSWPTPVDVAHVHGLSTAPDGTGLLIATHAGLLAYTDGGLARVGSLSSDLMGFSAGGADRLYASGHPGPSEDGHFALGLITSGDGGDTWEPVSLSGEADFHALDAWEGGVIGYDGLSGALLRSLDDGATWYPMPIDAPVVDLAVDDSGRLVAATAAGLQVSDDAEGTFALVPESPALVLVDFAPDGRLVGLDESGQAYTSVDLRTFEARGSVGESFTAMTTGPAGEVWVATPERLLRSVDEGATFTEALAWGMS
ncbi:F510_1955 family glycosylhydrolase [Nocardioides sp.]|uniref:F510_1955 family glycosylhydrolase n=1 Tax=Nocardioides sp. TaxID=35761 RepID=UPI00260B93BF|nr:hypothetical protein [Nocardioides sp.]